MTSTSTSPSASTSTRTAHIRIQGRVQGVGYRVWSHRTAVELGLSGWVRNRRDGSVEALFQGAPEAVDKMIARCADGPWGASVSRIEDLPDDGAFIEGFEVRETT